MRSFQCGLLKNRPPARKLFAASKIWALGKQRGIEQMEASRKLWGVPRFDLVQVHNLLDWEAHLETLSAWKREGRVRYLGITTSHGRRHDEMERIMHKVPLDFVQFTYNISDREAEQRLLPLARERRIAVIANRPFQHGDLFKRVKGKPLPVWARVWVGFPMRRCANVWSNISKKCNRAISLPLLLFLFNKLILNRYNSNLYFAINPNPQGE